MYLVEIPVLPHVKSLLVSIHGNEPIQANENNILGKEIEHVLQAHSQLDLFPHIFRCDTVTVNLSDRVAAYYKKFEHALNLGCFYEKQFHLALFVFVEAQMEAGVYQEQAIRNFYSKYNIDPDFYDTIAARMSIMRTRHKNLAEA